MFHEKAVITGSWIIRLLPGDPPLKSFVPIITTTGNRLMYLTSGVIMSNVKQSSWPLISPSDTCKHSTDVLWAIKVPFQQNSKSSITWACSKRISPTGGFAYGIPRNATAESSTSPSTRPQDVLAKTFPSRIGALRGCFEPPKKVKAIMSATSSCQMGEYVTLSHDVNLFQSHQKYNNARN